MSWFLSLYTGLRPIAGQSIRWGFTVVLHSSHAECREDKIKAHIPDVNRGHIQGHSHPVQAEVVTVDKFLKQSPLSKCTAAPGLMSKTYGRRKLKARHHALDSETRSTPPVQLEDRGDDEENVICLRKRTIKRVLDSEDEISERCSSPSEMPSSHEPSPASKRSKTSKKHKLDAKPLRERLFETIVKTHGRMDTEFSSDRGKPGEAQSTRSPLTFIPVPNTLLPFTAPRNRARQWTLIDPRKSTSIHSASFLTSGKRAADCVVPITEVKDMFDHVPDHRQVPDGDLKLATCVNSQARSHRSTNSRPPKPSGRSTARAPIGHPKRQENDSRTSYPPLTFVEIPRPARGSKMKKKAHSGTSAGAHSLIGYSIWFLLIEKCALFRIY